MIIRTITQRRRFISGDRAVLREIFHAAEESLEIGYSLAHAMVKPGQTTLPHRLKTSEVYYILSGTGRMRIAGEARAVRPGQAVYIPPGSIQSIENTGRSSLEFLCIVSPAWRPEDEEIL
jgi:mannose-6-phosphate isomerase-like protein (cupin superfamily)